MADFTMDLADWFESKLRRANFVHSLRRTSFTLGTHKQRQTSIFTHMTVLRTYSQCEELCSLGHVFVCVRACVLCIRTCVARDLIVISNSSSYHTCLWFVGDRVWSLVYPVNYKQFHNLLFLHYLPISPSKWSISFLWTRHHIHWEKRIYNFRMNNLRTVSVKTISWILHL